MLNANPDFTYDYQPPPPVRPTPLTFIALIQFLKGFFLILVATLPWLGFGRSLAYIPNLKDLLFLASHGKDPHGVMLFIFGLYAAAIGRGIWKLRRWSRNSLVFTSLCMLVLWLVHHNFDIEIPTMTGFSQVKSQTVYLLLLMDVFVFVYLKFHYDIIRCFPAKKRK